MDYWTDALRRLDEEIRYVQSEAAQLRPSRAKNVLQGVAARLQATKEALEESAS